MGGKNKQSQRTKNNVRPSSSGRSAELLSSGKFDASMTTVGGKLMPALFPTLAAVSLDAGLDPELAMCIKKLNKKDPITKTKALQELMELVNKSSVEDVEAALPGWSHFYKTLSVDIDCKVRECTQVCHGAIVRVCGRRIAPHLKQLLPSWLQSQYDDHAPAQSQAQLSLKNTFPDAKLPEVIAFCKTEILDFLEDNLTGKSALAAAGDGDSGRGAAAALHGLAWAGRHAPRALHAWLAERVAALLANDAFWKLAAHKESPVRGAWFAAMGSIVERFASTMDAKCGSRLLRVLLGAREHDARAAAQLWGCLLTCMHSVPDWHAWLDKKDLLAKRIINLLETGGWGDARQLSSTLLPLLASLPPETLTNEFYEQFFNAIFAGLEKKSVINSKSERQAWITGLSECVRYVSGVPRPGGAELCSAALRRWLDAVLSTKHEAQLATGLLKHSAQTMTELLKYWMRKSSEEEGDRYCALVRNFWQNVCATACAHSAGLSPPEAAAAATRLALFLGAMRHCFGHEPRRHHFIRFDGDEPAAAAPASPAAVPDAASTELFQHHLTAAAELVCARYIELARDTRAPDVLLPPLSPLLTLLPRAAIQSVAQRLDAASIYGLFENVLLPWLQDEDTRCEPVMDLAFQLLGHMSEEEQDATLAAFTQETVLAWALWRALSHPHVRGRAARRWLRGAGVRRGVRAAARRLGAGAGPRELLLRALTPADDDEMLVSEETVTSVVDILVDALDAQCSEPLSSVLAQLATTLAQRPPTNYHKLLLALFRLNLTHHRGSGALSPAAWLEARGSWQDGLLARPPAPRAQLRAEAAALLLRAALPDHKLDDLNIPSIEHATCLCPYLLTDCEQDAPSAADETVELIRQLFEPARKIIENPSSLDVFALRHDCIVSRLSCPFGDDNEAIAQIVKDCDESDVDELTKEDLVLRLTELLFRALCLRTLFLHRPGEDDSSTEDKQHTWCSVLLGDEHIQKEFCELLRDYVVLDSLHDGYAFWPHYEIIERAKSRLDAALQDIIAETPTALRQTILLALSERAAKEGYYWAYARSCYDAKATERSEDQSADKSDAENALALNMDNLAEVITGNGLYHSLQANLRWLPSTPPTTPEEESSPPSPALRTAHMVMLRAALAALDAERAPNDIRQQFAKDAVAAAQDGNAAPDVMVDLYYRHEKVMLGERDPLEVPWQTVVCSAAVAEYLAHMVEERGWSAAAHHWDFATISLCALLGALQKKACTKTAMLCVSSLRLLHSVRTFIAALPKECERRQPSPHVAALMDEWKDIFAPDIHTNVFNVVIKTLENPPPGPTSCIVARTLSALTSAAWELTWASLPAALRADSLSLQKLARTCAGALATTTHRAYKYLAHATLTALATELVLEDADKLAAWTERGAAAEDEARHAPPTLALAYFHHHYRTLLELLDAALANIQVGESTCEMACGSDSRSVALGALLLCDGLHAACARARGDLAHHYILAFREEKYTDLLLTCAMRLLPAEVFAFALDNNSTQVLPDRLVELFTTSRQFSVDEPEAGMCGGAGDVGALACRGVARALGGPGQAAARAAWAAAAPRPARALARLAAAAVAPMLLRDQFTRAAQRAKTLPDTELTLLPAAREAHAVHTVEDQQLRLTVTFSREHPLSPPKVQTPLVGPAAGSHWLLVYLGYQNGDLFNAVSLWVSAVSAKLERAPQCYICYCRLHPGEGVLPKVFCAQCRNKFHTACLRKWFTTSKKSSCPVCRAMF